MTNQAPFNVVVAPFDVYVAPVATAFPLISLATPAGPWVTLGTRGKRDQSDAGVTLSMTQKVDTIRGQGNAILKAVRTEEDVLISFEIMDVTLESLSYLLNSNTVTATAAASGTPGRKELSAYRGSDVNYVSLLIRGQSPYRGAGAIAQYQLPKCFQNGPAETKFSKSGVAMVKFEFIAVEGPNATDLDGDLGKWVADTTIALP